MASFSKERERIIFLLGGGTRAEVGEVGEESGREVMGEVRVYLSVFSLYGASCSWIWMLL